jgi:serine/threonine protein kinase
MSSKSSRRVRSKSRRTDTRTQERSRSRDKNRYIISKEGQNFLQTINNNGVNIKLEQYIQSGGFASVYSIKDTNLVCRITHERLSLEVEDEELLGLRIQQELANHSDNIVKIDEFDMYKVYNPEVAKDYCRERKREKGKPPRRDDWCILHQTEDPEKQEKLKKRIDARHSHFLNTSNRGIYAVMERIKSDLFDHYGSSHRKLSIEEDIEGEEEEEIDIEEEEEEEEEEINIEEKIDDMYSIFVQLMTVVSYIHSRAIVHRDIKPENIGIVFEEGKIKIKLFDFGIAINTTDLRYLREGVGRKGTDGYYDHDLYTHSTSFGRVLFSSLLYDISSYVNLNKENLELSDVYACCISMFYIAAYILKCVKKKQDFETFQSNKSNVQTRQGIIQKGIEDITSLTDVSPERKRKFIYMLQAIGLCVGERDNRPTAEQLLQHLERLQSTSGGKKKTRNKKSKKNKKNKKKKTKKKKTLV